MGGFTGHRERAVLGPVVFKLEQAVFRQGQKHVTVFVDPTAVDEQRRGDFFLNQIINKRLVVSAAALAAAGVKGERNDLVCCVQPRLYSGDRFAPLFWDIRIKTCDECRNIRRRCCFVG